MRKQLRNTAEMAYMNNRAKILKGVDARYVSEIDGRQFYNSETSDPVVNYAASKHIIGEWIEQNGVDNLLSGIRTGEIDALQSR